MLSFRKLVCGGVLAIAMAYSLMVAVAHANSSMGWLAPSSLFLNKTVDLAAFPVPGSNNIDCYFDRGSICSYSTPYGQADTTGQVKLNNSPRYAPVVGHMDLRQHFFAIPNSNTVLTYTTEPVHGAYAYINYNFSASMSLIFDPTGNYYYMNRPPDGKVADKAGHRLAIDLTSASFSRNSQWMIVSVPNIAMLRVNLQTLEVLPFAPGFSYDIGLSPSPITAITNDGRYAVFASKDFSRFAIYDLNTCAAVPDTINGPVSCQSRDLQAYMSNQLSGFTVPSGLRFISDNALSFYTRYTQNGVSKISKFIVSTAAGPIHQQDYLALGDSYISGEGAFNYLAGTDTDNNQCHVSKVSYPLLIGGELSYNSFHSVACSGATTEDVIDTSDNYISQAEPKLKKEQRAGIVPTILAGFQQGYVNQLDFVQQYQPKIITLSVGGNDIGFSARLQSCLSAGTCYSTYEDRLEYVREVNQAFPKLAGTYAKLKQIGADDARIYVIGYPQIAKAGGDCALNVHMNEAELEFAQQAIDYLDTVIKAAAAKAGVYYVDTQDALNEHRLCEAKPGSVAMNGVTAGNDFPDWLGGPVGRESYHPNEFGHLLLENKVLAATHNLTVAMPAADSTAGPPAEAGLSILDAPHSGRSLNATQYDNKLTGDFAYRGTSVDVSVNGANHALSPGSTLHAQLHSDPIDLGNFKTDATDNITTQLAILPSVPAGYHTLHFYGTDINGQPIDIFKTIYIGAMADDIDGDGAADSSQMCVGLMSSGTDYDRDGTDDACDADISAAPVTSSSTGSSAGGALPSIIPAASKIITSSPEVSTASSTVQPQVLGASISQSTAAKSQAAKNDKGFSLRYYLISIGVLVLSGVRLLFRNWV